MKTPLPTSDDSDLFYSPDDSLNRGKLSDVRARDAAKESAEDDFVHDDSLMLRPGSRSLPGMRLASAVISPPTPFSHSELRDVGRGKKIPHDQAISYTMGEEEDAKSEEDEDEEMTQDDGETSDDADDKEEAEKEKETTFAAEELKDAPFIGSSLAYVWERVLQAINQLSWLLYCNGVVAMVLLFVTALLSWCYCFWQCCCHGVGCHGVIVCNGIVVMVLLFVMALKSWCCLFVIVVAGLGKKRRLPSV